MRCARFTIRFAFSLIRIFTLLQFCHNGGPKLGIRSVGVLHRKTLKGVRVGLLQPVGQFGMGQVCPVHRPHVGPHISRQFLGGDGQVNFRAQGFGFFLRCCCHVLLAFLVQLVLLVAGKGGGVSIHRPVLAASVDLFLDLVSKGLDTAVNFR